jgi:tetratricopeptide (TPR) repeat protein
LSLNLNPSDVIEANLKALQVQSDDFFAYYNLAKAYEFHGQVAQACVAYQKAVALNPEDPYAQFALGKLYSRMGQTQEARFCFQRVIASHSPHIPAHLSLASLLIREGAYEEAIPRLKKIIALDPDFHQAYFYLCQVFGKIGFQKEAIEQINLALELNPGNYYYYFLKGELLMHLGDTSAAEKAFRRASLIKEDDLASLVNLGVVLLELGRTEEALKPLVNALEYEPHHRNAHHAIGRAYLKLGLYNEAESSLQRVQKLEPFFEDVYLDLAELYVNMGEWRKACSSIEKVPDALRQGSAFYILQARIYRALKDYEAGEKALLRLIESKIYRSDIYTLLGKLRKDQLDLAGARHYFQLALELDPGFREAMQELQELEEQIGNSGEAESYAAELKALPCEESKPEPEGHSRILAVETQMPSLELDEFEAGIRKDPENPDLLMTYGDHLFKLGLLEDALAKWEMVYALTPNRCQILLRLADAHRLRSNMDKSQNFLLKAIDVDPSSLELYLSLASLLMDQGHLEEAREWLGRARFRFPSESLPLLHLIRIARFMENDEELQQLCDSLEEIEPGHVVGLCSRGILELKSGAFEQSAKYLREVVQKTGGRDRESLCYLGIVLRNKGELEEAYSCFKQAVAQCEEDSFLHYNLGVILKSQGNYVLAEDHLKKAKQYDPEDVQTLQHLGSLYFEQGNYQAAVSEFLAVVRLESGDFLSNFHLGRSFFELGQFQKALRYFKQAEVQQPSDPTLNYFLALSYQEAGNPVEALKTAQKATRFCSEQSSLLTYSRELVRRLESCVQRV